MGSQRSAADLLAAYNENFIGFAGSSDFLEESAEVTGGAKDDALDPDNLYGNYDALLSEFVKAHPELARELGAVVLTVDYPSDDDGDDCERAPCASCGDVFGGDEDADITEGADTSENAAEEDTGDMDEATVEGDTFSSSEVPPEESVDLVSSAVPDNPPADKPSTDIFRFVVDA